MSTPNEHSGTRVRSQAGVIVQQRPEAARVETMAEWHGSKSSQEPRLRRPLIYAAAIQPSEISWPRIFPPL
jgi:hypothetical protein